MTALTTAAPLPPNKDKRWKTVETTARRYGHAGHALIETLHTVQECFGYLDDASLRYVAALLKLPLSKVLGVATFYRFFILKPPGAHTCVICTGTSCYIQGAGRLVASIRNKCGVAPGQTTKDGRISLVAARCLGSCGLAPAAVLDGEVVGPIEPADLLNRLASWERHDS